MATIYERDDAPNSLDTRYSVEPGDVFWGTLTREDADLVRIEMTAGTAYELNLTGRGQGDRLDDPVLSLWNADIELVAFNRRYAHDRLDARIVFTPDASGDYYINIWGNGGESGNYELRVAEGVSEPVSDFASYDDIAHHLTDAYWQWQGTTRRSFDVEPGGTLDVDISALTVEGQQLARWALEAWAHVTGIDFRFTRGAHVHLTFDDEAGGWAQNITSGGRILSAHVNVSADWLVDHGASMDSYNFQAYIHEIGHALGLGHPGNYPVDFEDPYALFGVDNRFANDSWQVTVMSYFSQTNNTHIDADYANVVTPMIADIIAVHDLYGVSADLHTGDTRYGANANVGGYLGELFALITGEASEDLGTYAGGPIALTIYDRGGTDTIDLHTDPRDQRVDLNAEAISDVLGLTGNLLIARDTVIEHFIAGSGNDVVAGNGADNRLEGRAGDDRLYGRAGSDTLHGNEGNDTLDGGEGGDLFVFDPSPGVEVIQGFTNGDDRIDLSELGVRRFGDVLATAVPEGVRLDFTDVGGGAVLLEAFDLDDLDASDFLFSSDDGDDQGGIIRAGGPGDDTLEGGVGNDTLHGGLGDDEIRGGSGADSLSGGPGFDRVDYRGSPAAVVVDLATQSASGGHAEGDTLTGFEGAHGSDHDDSLYGGPDDNALAGGAGGDYLDGRAGADRLFGEAGNDTLHGGAGDDALAGHEGADALHGEGGRDLLSGHAGHDVLEGGDDRDRLYGGADHDTLRGGENDDLLRGGMGEDALEGGEGGDRLYGDQGADTLDGDAGNDHLFGGTGDDVLRGGAGDDVHWGGTGADSLEGGEGNDRFSAQHGEDTLHGGAGNDALSGGTGNDRLVGDGDDDRLFGQAGDDVLEGGVGSDALIGGNGNDSLDGDGGDDRLFGQAGDDRLIGGGGDDVLRGGAGNDVFVFSGAHGIDTIADFVDGRDLLDLSALGATGLDVVGATAVATGVRLDLAEAGGGAILLKGFDLADLDAGDFLF